MSDAWNQRLRMIRFRRKRERSTFREELRILPKWLVWTCVGLYILALIIGIGVNLHNMHTSDPIFPDDSLRGDPVLSCLGLAGVITLMATFFSVFILTLGYVYRDAKRRGMNAGLWTLLVREPLPYACPQCAATVSARFNFCPNCKCNLHPACPQCQRVVSDTDKFCPYCAAELAHAKPAPTA